jgi:hypothetical protein
MSWVHTVPNTERIFPLCVSAPHAGMMQADDLPLMVVDGGARRAGGGVGVGVVVHEVVKQINENSDSGWSLLTSCDGHHPGVRYQLVITAGEALSFRAEFRSVNAPAGE